MRAGQTPKTLRERRPDCVGVQPVRFVAVGIGAAALFFVLSYVLVSMGMPPFAGSVVAYAVGVRRRLCGAAQLDVRRAASTTAMPCRAISSSRWDVR